MKLKDGEAERDVPAKPGEALPQAGVLSREGWTKAAVRKFLGEPDRRSAGAPMRLYLVERVEAVEATVEWQQWVERSARRRAAARAAAETRAQAHYESMIDFIDQARRDGRLTPRRVQMAQLHAEAERHLLHERRLDSFTVRARDLENQIRHGHTAYDWVRDQLKLRPTSESMEREMAYEHLARIVSVEISAVYPELGEMRAREEAEQDRLAQTVLG